MKESSDEQANQSPDQLKQLIEVNIYESQLGSIKEIPGLLYNVLKDPPAQGIVLQKSHQEESSKHPLIITAKELDEIEGTPNRYLLKPFLPVTGTALIAGKPDTGKSQFARQLAIEVSQGATDFIGFKLELTHSRAIYVATEDDPDNFRFLSNRQHAGLGYQPNMNLSFVFADNLDQGKLISVLEELLKSKPADLLIIDSFSDVFQGNDMNSNSQMRATTRKFDNLAKKHNCLVLFVHHINKSGYDRSPSQQSIQGGSGLAQKVRLAWQMSSKDGTNIKYLNVVKGNYTPREYKEKALGLNFDETNFVFTRNNDDPSVKALSPIDTQEDKYERKVRKLLPDIRAAIDSASGMKYKLLVEFLQNEKGIPEATAKRMVKWLKEKEIITLDEDQKLYFWNDSTSDEEPESNTEFKEGDENTEEE